MWDEVLSGAEAANELRQQVLALKMELEQGFGDREIYAKDLE